ncbi:MAG: DUF2520 domain-containing protein [Candidatus Cyclonatronum sp.]|uniref:Rossmann-like and DUF2520 domain-containing protein n=1 Tax=Cyclonatronum sp. TaxID=3024185 RepID=UPI0025BD2076|nr:Rossmann-like and DUF2520 domain-containing protein [Cyclonatronum sp.]MCH8485433.1 DUF2520 domain-containing protein [Cyclonatronum sp.]
MAGSGKLARALARAISENEHNGGGLRLSGIFARNKTAAAAVARNTGAPKYGQITDIRQLEGLLLLCVSDDALPAVARQLAGIPAAGGALVAHLSGALDLSPLASLQQRGIATGSLHPLQSFPEGAGPETFRGIYASLLGPPEATAQLHRLASELGCTPLEVSAQQKKQLHIAAVFASNYMVALAHLAGRSVPGLALPVTEVLRPLMETTLQNIFAKGPTAALTGPVSRGDTGTVETHLRTLTADPFLQDDTLPAAYRLLGRVAASQALSDGRLSPETYRELLTLLSEPHGSAG